MTFETTTKDEDLEIEAVGLSDEGIKAIKEDFLHEFEEAKLGTEAIKEKHNFTI